MKGVLRIVVAAALILALIMSLAACGGKPEEEAPPVTESSPEPPPVSETPEPKPSEKPSEEPAEPVVTPKSVTPVTAIYTNPLDTVSFYDENFFYEMNPKYKVWYVTYASPEFRPEYALLDLAFAHWAQLMNVEYGGMISAEGNTNVYLETLSQLISDGANGLLIDADENNYPRTAEILGEAGIPWMTVTTAPRNLGAESTPLLHPYIASQYESVSTAIAGKLFAIKDELWPDVPYENIRLILIDTFTVPAILNCTQAIASEWTARTGLFENCLNTSVVDRNSAVMRDPEAVIEEALALSEGFEYFLIYSFSDEYVNTINNALDIKGLAPNSAIVSITADTEASRELMFIQWENSQQNALEAMMYLPATLRAEAAFGALYAFMSGTATPETIWPSWINQNDKGGGDGTYATYAPPYFWLEYDNYKQIIKWTDVYSGANLFPDYTADGITPYDYEQWRGVPEEYALRPVEPEDTGDAAD